VYFNCSTNKKGHNIMPVILCCYNLRADVPTSDINLPKPDDIYTELHHAVSSSGSDAPVPPVVSLLATTNNVRHVHEQQAFTIEGPDGTIHAVRLFPTETCTCPASTTCCHIVAAKKSIGLDCKERRILNLSKLRKNSR